MSYTSDSANALSYVSSTLSLVRIEGVPDLDWVKSCRTTYAGALAAALAVTDHPVSSRDIMALSGLAFRTRWLASGNSAKWCSSCPAGECPDEIAATERNTGWHFEAFMDDSSISPELLRRLIGSISAGVPAVVCEPKWNCATAIGYSTDGRRLLLKDYSKGELAVEPSELPAFTLIPRQFDGEPEPKDAARDALRLAIRNWQIPRKRNGTGEYWYGRLAFEHWIDDVLKAPLAPASALPSVTWWNADVMLDARRDAAEWLRSIRPLFNEISAQHLTAAAELYNGEYELLRTAVANNIFDPTPDRWTSEGRSALAGILSEASRREQQAVGELQQVCIPRSDRH